MRIVFTILLIGMIGASAVCLYLIREIKNVYDQIWGSDVSLATWQRKGWAFTAILVAQLIGVGSILFNSTKWWISTIYFVLMLLSLCSFADSYRMLLTDLKKLPRKKS